MRRYVIATMSQNAFNHCRATVLTELHAQQDIVASAAPSAPDHTLMRLLSIGLSTFCDIERRAKPASV